MNRAVRRRCKIIWVWLLTAPLSKTRAVRTALWFLPWVAMNMIVTFSFGFDVAFTFLSLGSAGSFWALGYLSARRLNVRHESEALAAYVAEPVDLVEFDLKRLMQANSKL